jgi:protease-4
VEEIAEGRVWDGGRAIALGLVDQEGSLADAVAQAADLAGLAKVRAEYINQPASFLQSLEQLGQRKLSTFLAGCSLLTNLRRPAGELGRLTNMITRQPDPGHLYAYSLLVPDFIDF